MKRIHVIAFNNIVEAAAQLDAMGLTILASERDEPFVMFMVECNDMVWRNFEAAMTKGRVVY